MRKPSEGRGGCRKPPAKLLQSYRHSLTSLLVIGGQVDERQAVAQAFHETGPLRQGPFVFLDCAEHGAQLHGALEAVMTETQVSAQGNPVLAAWGGTLHLDSIERLDAPTQRLLLCLVHELQSDRRGVLRLSVGASFDLLAALHEGRFHPALFDALDKIRFELGRSLAA